MSWAGAILIGYTLIAFILIYIAFQFKDKNEEDTEEEGALNAPLTFFFLLLGLFILLAGVGTVQPVLDANNITSTDIETNVNITYKALIFIIILTIAYFLIMFIYKAIMSIMDKKKRREDGEDEEFL